LKSIKNESFRAAVLIASLLILSPCDRIFAILVQHTTSTSKPSAGKTAFATDDAFIDDLCHRIFQYFIEQADEATGLVLDRARVDGSRHEQEHASHNIASIGATGFGFTALCIGVDRHWIDENQARARLRAGLRFFLNRAENAHGWFYHWMDLKTGERRWQSEISSIDTALLLAGILTVRQRFANDPEIVALATRIYERVDFQWMLNGDRLLLSHGWKPEAGFLKSRWDNYSEHTILNVLAIGSPAHAIPGESWYGWRRQWMTYAGYRYITGGPLFIHQYSHSWIDYRGLKEERPPHVDYFENSVRATLAHRAFCKELSREFPDYSDTIWGITASDSAKGYVAWGGPPRDPAIDGTIVPCAAGGSLMFTRDLSVRALRAMYEKFGDRVYGRYGFVDAFNPLTGWIDTDVIGIDLGITLLSAENSRSGKVWKWFMSNKEIVEALHRARLR